ncbi:MAG: dTMP kinase [Phycisphaeraceae bacterium]|nr:dTMP kinase [Phycisphaeraceae bacterium]
MVESPDAWMTQLAGRFLVFDGPDGSGKSTQFARLAEACEAAGVTVCSVREPGGTPVGERIRELLLDPEHDEMAVRAEMLLYMASRAQLMEQRIEPALAEGSLVLADRFVSSTLVYQGYAGGLDPAMIREVAEVALQGRWPDLTVVFDVDEETAARRLVARDKSAARYLKVTGPTLFTDRIEMKGQAFQRKVREGYLELARTSPEAHLVIDATADPDAVFADLNGKLREWTR